MYNNDLCQTLTRTIDPRNRCSYNGPGYTLDVLRGALNTVTKVASLWSSSDTYDTAFTKGKEISKVNLYNFKKGYSASLTINEFNDLPERDGYKLY